MNTYFADDTNEFFDTVKIIENKNIRKATIIITNDVEHCQLMYFFKGRKLTIAGENKPKYSFYINPKNNISSNPNWVFNSTLFFYTDKKNVNFSNLHFIYLIAEGMYDFIKITHDYDEKANKNIKVIDLKNEQLFNSFNVLLMEFYNSKIDFKDCIFENDSNRTFEIIVKKQSQITFENCVFNGEFIFISDIDSKIIIQ